MNTSIGREFATNSITDEDICAIMRDHPTLGAHGFGCFGQYHRDYHGDLKAELRKNREELVGSVEQCSNVCKWLSSVAKSKTINKRHSSYSLKHYFERHCKQYSCSNGAFIAAAIHLGFDWVRDGSAAYFNFDQTSLDRRLVTSN